MKLSEVTLFLLRLIALMQGGFTIGIVLSIFAIYLKRLKQFSLLQLHIVSVALGLCCLVASTMITMWRDIYVVGDIWYWLTLPGYILCDFALVVKLIKQRQERNDKIN